jgi:hypothetical protein
VGNDVIELLENGGFAFERGFLSRVHIRHNRTAGLREIWSTVTSLRLPSSGEHQEVLEPVFRSLRVLENVPQVLLSRFAAAKRPLGLEKIEISRFAAPRAAMEALGRAGARVLPSLREIIFDRSQPVRAADARPPSSFPALERMQARCGDATFGPWRALLGPKLRSVVLDHYEFTDGSDVARIRISQPVQLTYGNAPRLDGIRRLVVEHWDSTTRTTAEQLSSRYGCEVELVKISRRAVGPR